MNKRNTHEAGKKKRKYPALAKDKIEFKRERERERERERDGGRTVGCKAEEKRTGRTQAIEASRQRAKHLEKGRWRRGIYKSLETREDKRRGLNL